MTSLEEVMINVKNLVREVGGIQKENLGKKDLHVSTKSSEVDLVTEIDELSEEYILKAIRDKYPGHCILSEESGKHGNGDSDYLWIIDPLDGTTNYAQGLPLFSISIALQYRKETVLGVVYLPVLDLLFEAVRGQNAFLNGKRITVGTKTNLRECLLSTGFPYDQHTNSDNNVNYFAYFVPRARGLRRLGSAAYDLANIAAGILDGYWELNLNPWDVAAGTLLVQEAGGKVIFLEDKRGVSLIAGNEVIADKIYQAIIEVDEYPANKN